jgi:hypothetical protein
MKTAVPLFVILLAALPVRAAPPPAEPSAPAAGNDTAPAPVPGAPARLRALLDATGVKYTVIDDAAGAYAVAFQPSAVAPKAPWSVSVQLNDPGHPEFVLVFAQVVRARAGRELPRRVIKAALEFDGRTPGPKMTWDRATDAIHVQWEVPLAHATSGLLAWATRAVADTLDAQAGRFHDMLDE